MDPTACCRCSLLFAARAVFKTLNPFHNCSNCHRATSTLCTHLTSAAAALSYLDDKAIIHRDIKLPNILLHDGQRPPPPPPPLPPPLTLCAGKLKLADFGISKVLSGEYAKTVMGGAARPPPLTFCNILRMVFVSVYYCNILRMVFVSVYFCNILHMVFVSVYYCNILRRHPALHGARAHVEEPVRCKAWAKGV